MWIQVFKEKWEIIKENAENKENFAKFIKKKNKIKRKHQSDANKLN